MCQCARPSDEPSYPNEALSARSDCGANAPAKRLSYIRNRAGFLGFSPFHLVLVRWHISARSVLFDVSVKSNQTALNGKDTMI